MLLLLLYACDGPPEGPARVAAPGTPSTPTAPGVDADGDGSPAGTDCDDADPAVSPTAPEVCDGRDQDCDGAVDEGVPHDALGCVDPGPPAWDDRITTLQLTSRTGTSTFAPTDDPAEFCVGDGLCWPMDIPDWDDYASGGIDVVTVEGLDLARSALTGLSIRALDGSDQWSPVGFQLTADGEPIQCADGLTVKIGTDSGDSPEWHGDLGGGCVTVWDSPLTVGPLVGTVDEDGARIWYRTDATRAVRLRLAPTAAALTDAPVVHHGYPAVDRDFTEVVEVHGLGAEATWFYDLEIEGVRHGPWSFRTAPPPDTPARFRLAFGSCAYQDDEPIFGVIAAWAPDVFLFAGDNHYGNTADRDALRQNYRHAATLPLRRDLLPRVSILHVWDDHDFVGDNTDGTAPGKEVALRVFTEYTANPGYGLPEVPGIFSTHRHGPAEFFLLDDRTWRGLDDSVLGDAQEAWLYDALAASDAPFKFIVSGSQFTTQGTGDSWAVWPEAQERFVAALADIPGVVLLSGDVHHSELRLLPGVGYDLPELTSSPLALGEPGNCPGDSEILACWEGDNFIGVDVDATAADPTLRVSIVDVSGVERASWTLHHSDLE